MPLDPAATTTTASRPISPLPQPHPHPHHHYPSQQQTVPIRAPTNPLLAKPHDPHFVYPFAPKGVRGLAAADHGVAGAFPPPSLVYGGGVRGMPLDYLSHALHVPRPPSHVPFAHVGNAATTPAASSPVKKAAPRSVVVDINGGKDMSTREKSREDTYIVVRDRKVRIMEDASLYALCRSWLRNGINEESQPQQKDVMKALPKPLPASMVTSYLSNKKEDEKDEDEQEENEQSVEHLSPQDLLKRHIKRAKKVRARLREQRLQRITRYRSRLRLLLPPALDQCRNDTAAGN
ncbi:mitotic cell cycle [Spatholobus suberectus]|nr:mitotic cell cycle [Spatholobus suberectus]